MKSNHRILQCILAAFVLWLCTACPIDFGGGTSWYTPATIASVTAVAADKEVALTWTTSGDTSYTTFRITVSTASGETSSQTPEKGTTGVLFQDLQNGTEYTFTVSSVYNGSVYSEKSDVATPYTVSITPTGYVAGFNDCIKVSDTDTVIEIGNVKGKLISYASINAGDTSISPEKRRRLAYAKNGTTGSGPAAQLVSTGSPARAASQSTQDIRIQHFVPPKTLRTESSSARAVSSTQSADTFTKSAPTVGQTLTLWRDTNAAMDTYRQTQMTLRAIGYSGGSAVCLVWVPDTNYDTTNYGGKTVNSTICQSIANTFARLYAQEEAVFGQTSNKLITYKAATKLDAIEELAEHQNDTTYLSNMASNGQTGTYVNIVIYDIGNDYSSSSGGVVGYFYSKDYYEKDSNYKSGQYPYYSNAGKFFYLDAPFCNYRPEEKDFVGTGTVSKTALSTLFHEYQHMIAWGQKDMKGIDTDCTEDYLEGHAFNEMMSMLAEDLMTDPLSLYGTADYVAQARLPAFNMYYWYSGALEYLTDSSTSVISYSTAYGLGSYVARNYGGAELIHYMATNSSYGKDCIINAIKSVGATTLKNGEEITFENLMAEYVQACVFRTAYANEHEKPTHNVTAQGSGNDMTLHAINLFSADYRYQTSESSPYYYGPLYLNSLAQDQDIRPTGFQIFSVGKAESDTITLYFTKKSAADTIYVYIQDYFEQTVADTTAPADSN